MVTSDKANSSIAIPTTVSLPAVSGFPKHDICFLLYSEDEGGDETTWMKLTTDNLLRISSFPTTNFPLSLARLRMPWWLIMHAESCRAPRMVLRRVDPHSTIRVPSRPIEPSLSDRGFRVTWNGFPGPSGSATEPSSIGGVGWPVGPRHERSEGRREQG
ncbi:hypothetical protein OG21DRAFT_144915 [Imleria badia]|nr:hypothetical protein OG21DRAFT_144915 [Imleria badia]